VEPHLEHCQGIRVQGQLITLQGHCIKPI
jgi:hypothetical protein